MGTSHDGDTISVGMNIWIPATVLNVSPGSTNQLTVKAAYSGNTIMGQVAGTDTHVNKDPRFPDQ